MCYTAINETNRYFCGTMDITTLTHHHILFLTHPEKEDFYAIVDLNFFDPEHFFDYLAMHNKGIHFTLAFAYYLEGSGMNDFQEFLKSNIATGHEYIDDSYMLLRDYYEFKTFDGYEQWLEKFNQHKEAQRRFWLLQQGENKKPEIVQKTIFD